MKMPRFQVDSLVESTKKTAADASQSLQRWKIMHKQAKVWDDGESIH